MLRSEQLKLPFDNGTGHCVAKCDVGVFGVMHGSIL
jgi:hypothetical protein